MQLNDKEEALAHQRKVSYMLARALEDKDTAAKENKDKGHRKEEFPFKKPWHKSSEFSMSCDSVHLGVQMFNSAHCACSVSQTDPNCTRTLKRSCSLPSSILLWRHTKHRKSELRAFHSRRLGLGLEFHGTVLAQRALGLGHQALREDCVNVDISWKLCAFQVF